MLGFYETPAHIRSKARSLGLDLDSAIDSNALELLWLPPAENIVDEVIHGVVNKVREGKIRRVFVDGLVAMRDSLMISDRMPYAINALSMQLAALNATALYTTEIPEMRVADPVMPTDELSAMVDNVILLNTGRRDQAFRRYLSIIKLRDSSFDPRTHEFHIDGKGILFGPDPRVGPAYGKAG
jgi:circadian clock protein KaiC